MPTPGLVRRLGLSGDYSDLDWTNPANPPPGNARRIKCVGSTMMFDLIAKASTDEGALEVDIDTLLVDAWIGYEGGPRDPADPSGPKTIRRGLSVVEAQGAAGAPLSGRIRLVASDVERGAIARINLALTLVTVVALDVILVSGGRPL